MSYRVRFTYADGSHGWLGALHRTKEDAEWHIRTQPNPNKCFTYTVEEVQDAPEPGSMAAHHVEILRKRVKELEAVQKAMSQDLALALQLGDALRHAMRTGEWRAGNDAGMANSAIAGWDRWKPSLAKAPSVPEAPGEGGDSDRRRLEVLERYLEGDSFRQIWKTSMGPFAAGTKTEGKHFDATTLADLADKISASWEAEP